MLIPNSSLVSPFDASITQRAPASSSSSSLPDIIQDVQSRYRFPSNCFHRLPSSYMSYAHTAAELSSIASTSYIPTLAWPEASPAEQILLKDIGQSLRRVSDEFDQSRDVQRVRIILDVKFPSWNLTMSGAFQATKALFCIKFLISSISYLIPSSKTIPARNSPKSKLPELFPCPHL